MKPSNIITIIKKELRSYFDSPTAYIALILFLLVWQFLFFRDAFIIAEASLRNLMAYVPWLLLVMIPAITMGSIANENSDGTIEFLLTHPLRLVEFVVGKFLASVLFVSLALLFMIPIGISFSFFGNLDWGVVAGQYLSAVLLAGMFCSVGLFISSLLNNQITALLVSVTANFMLIIIGLELVTLSLPGRVATLLEKLSVLSHFNSMARGVIDVRDVWYFVSAILIFLALAYLNLLRQRLGNQRQIYRQYMIGVVLFIGISLALNIVGERIPGRFDLTADKIYQLSPTTVEILTEVDDVVNITLYATPELPAQIRPIVRDTKDLLRDYQLYSQGNVRFTIKDPSSSEQIAQEANSLGIQEVQFNVIGQEELQLRRGYFGIAVEYASQTEIIPIVNTATDLEYQLTGMITKLSADETKNIAFLTGHGELDLATQLSFISSELENQYTVSQLDLENQDLAEASPAALVIAQPKEPIPADQREQIFEYFQNGGSIMILTDGVIVSPEVFNASVNDNSLVDFLPLFGLELGQDLVYDQAAASNLNFAVQGGNSYTLPYALWPRVEADPETNTTLTKNIRSVVLPWPSSLETNQQRLDELGLQANRLYKTSQFAGSQTSNFIIAPDQIGNPTSPQEYSVAYSLLEDADKEADQLSRAIVISDSDFITDNIIQNFPENLAFGLEAVAWLSQEQSLAQIQLKQREPRVLQYENKTNASLIRYFNMGLAVLVPVIIGTARLVRRRSIKHDVYQYETN